MLEFPEPCIPLMPVVVDERNESLGREPRAAPLAALGQITVVTSQRLLAGVSLHLRSPDKMAKSKQPRRFFNSAAQTCRGSNMI